MTRGDRLSLELDPRRTALADSDAFERTLAGASLTGGLAS
jgi:hypothetical protein